MSELRRCPQCDAEIPANSPIGLCPRCLLKAGNDSQSAADSANPGPTKITPPASGFAPPSVEELAPLFPQLEILELLGKGGMGAVYKARQPGLDRLVAVKILPPEISRDPTFAERFQREARALARLSHPHIVAVYDFGQTLECGGLTPPSIQQTKAADPSKVSAGNNASSFMMEGGVKPPHSRTLCYIVMEFVDGANLRQMIKTGTLAPAEALAIVPQICEALQFAHDEGVVHRDIKPENILVDKRGRVKIADFGLAKLLGQDASDHSLTATNQVMGTLRYMAPEQMQGSREVDHRADIYSLGVVFYELLTGELPMGRFAPPSKKVQVDVRFDEIVLRALEQDPEQRYQHASDVKSEIDSIRTTPAPPKPVEQRDPLEPFREVARFAMTPNPSYAKQVGIPVALLFGLGAIATLYATAVYGQKGNYQERPIRLIVTSWATLFWVTTIILHILFFARRRASVESIATPSDDSGRATRPSYGKRVGIPMTILFGLFMMATITAQSVYGLNDNNYPGHPKVLIIATGATLFCLGVIILHVAFFARRVVPTTVWATVTLEASSEPRLNRLAVIGLILVAIGTPIALFDLCAVVDVVVIPTALGQPIATKGPIHTFGHEIRDSIVFSLACLFVASILSAFAIDQIKRSDGKLYGLRLAVVDMLVFPLLMLAALVAVPIELLFVAMHAGLAGPVVSAVIGILGCFFAGRTVWRAILRHEKHTDERSESESVVRLEKTSDTKLPEAFVAQESLPYLLGWLVSWLLRERWFVAIAQTACALVYAVCLIAFFSFQSLNTQTADGSLTKFEVGQPTAWLTLEASKTGQHVRFEFITLTHFVALIGLVSLAIYRWLEQRRLGKPHSMTWHYVLWIVFLAGAVGFGMFTLSPRHNSSPNSTTAVSQAALPPLDTITNGIGVEFTVPAGQVVTFEIVTRRDNETVPVLSHCAYQMAPEDKPVTGQFRWTRIFEEASDGHRGRRWRIETLTAGGGGGHSDASLLPVELNEAVGKRLLPLGVLESNEESIHWGNADVHNLPANGLIGLRVTVKAHGQQHGNGSGTGHIDWKRSQPTQSTSRRKLTSEAP